MSNVLVRIPFLALTLAATTITAQSVTDQEVTTAIGRMKRHFYRIQDRQSGHWEASYRNSHYGGETALVVLALLLSGESAQSPPLAKAIGWLAKAQLNSTYAVALRAMVWSHLPDSYHERLVVDAKWLLEAAASHGRHLFDYRSHKTSRFDHSVTQFATLGLWGAAKRGVRIPAVFWSRLQTHFLDSQTLDGGWGYNDTGAAYGSMTAAGLTVLLVCRQQLNPNSTDVPERLNRSIDDALKWLDHRFDGAKNPASGRWPYYYLASIERVALAGGIRQLNGQDWYRVGARHILDQHFIDESSPAFGSVTSSPWQTAFALMFLARGQYPVWISKLAVPELRWNRRPNDIHQLTEYLSNVSERELNWQVVTVDSPAQNWINAPLLYLTSSESVALTESQQQHVKRYLELGGTLVASPIKGSSKFKVSIRRLVRAMHPRFRMRPLGADHPLFRSVHRLKAGTGGPVFGLSNGVRELVLLADRDWGIDFQSTARKPGGPRMLAANLFAYVTDLGLWPGRLSTAWEEKIDRTTSGQVIIARPRYNGEWLPEPAAWDLVTNRVFNRTGLQVRCVDVEFETISPDAQRPDLVHLAGIDPVGLTALQLTALERFARRGGTVLVETVSGRGAFAGHVEQQLAERFKTAAVPIPSFSPLLTGTGIDGAYDTRRVRYRRRAAEALSVSRNPRLAAFYFDGRPAVIISREDMSLAMLGVRHMDIIGYNVDSARRMAVNLLLWCHGVRQRAAETDPVSAPQNNR